VSGSAPDELPWDRPKPDPDDGDLFTMPSDSSSVLTIGDETFPVVNRVPVDEKCLADEAHQMFEVETLEHGKFIVCDECHSSRRIAPDPAEES